MQIYTSYNYPICKCSHITVPASGQAKPNCVPLTPITIIKAGFQMDSLHLSFSLLMNLRNYKDPRKCSQILHTHKYRQTHTKSAFTKARLRLTMESVRLHPATTHEAKCFFHDHAGRAGDQKKNYQQPDSHTIIYDIIPINTQSRKRKRRNENNKIKSGLVL